MKPFNNDCFKDIVNLHISPPLLILNVAELEFNRTFKNELIDFGSSNTTMQLSFNFFFLFLIWLYAVVRVHKSSEVDR